MKPPEKSDDKTPLPATVCHTLYGGTGTGFCSPTQHANPVFASSTVSMGSIIKDPHASQTQQVISNAPKKIIEPSKKHTPLQIANAEASRRELEAAQRELRELDARTETHFVAQYTPGKGRAPGAKGHGR